MLTAATARSIIVMSVLLDELAEIRRTGFAYDREELADGICAIGVGITTAPGQPYAVSVAVPAQRFDPALAVIRAAVPMCRASIEAALRAALAPCG